jgi:hypothetical protein
MMPQASSSSPCCSRCPRRGPTFGLGDGRAHGGIQSLPAAFGFDEYAQQDDIGQLRPSWCLASRRQRGRIHGLSPLRPTMNLSMAVLVNCLSVPSGPIGDKPCSLPSGSCQLFGRGLGFHGNFPLTFRLANQAGNLENSLSLPSPQVSQRRCLSPHRFVGCAVLSESLFEVVEV